MNRVPEPVTQPDGGRSAPIDAIDRRIQRAMAVAALPVMRTALGVVFVWFGWLKVVGVSPAAGLVEATTAWFTAPVHDLMGVPPGVFVVVLGWWEVLIGLCLIDPLRWGVFGARRTSVLTRVGIALLALQMPGTFLPLVLLPDACFGPTFGSLTMEGQYIVKNLVLIAGAVAVGASVRR